MRRIYLGQQRHARDGKMTDEAVLGCVLPFWQISVLVLSPHQSGHLLMWQPSHTLDIA